MTQQPCPPLPTCQCPDGPPDGPNLSGPDEPGIACWVPIDCCGWSPCAVTRDDFICQIRTLLPQGEIWAPIAPTTPPEIETGGSGAVTVGCARVGCEQLIFGSCCDDRVLCTDDPDPPNLAIYDAFASVSYEVLRALCAMLNELDPCTADKRLQRWAKRFGLLSDDLCAPVWSDEVLKLLLCTLAQIQHNVMNWNYLRTLAGQFGADLKVQPAGGFGVCFQTGWWTMGRMGPADCPKPEYCPPADPRFPQWIRLTPPCEQVPDSLNLIVCPSDIRLPDNCNLRLAGTTYPHNPELYAAFKWLLPKILPQPIYWCVYDCDEAICIPCDAGNCIEQDDSRNST